MKPFSKTVFRSRVGLGFPGWTSMKFRVWRMDSFTSLRPMSLKKHDIFLEIIGHGEVKTTTFQNRGTDSVPPQDQRHRDQVLLTSRLAEDKCPRWLPCFFLHNMNESPGISWVHGIGSIRTSSSASSGGTLRLKVEAVVPKQNLQLSLNSLQNP